MPIHYDDITPEYLKYLTEVNASGIFKSPNSSDDLTNWSNGKKLTALTILDCYINLCKASTCKVVKDCCIEYLDEIHIQEAKELKAYFIWEHDGRTKNKSIEEKGIDYARSCNEIMQFCTSITEKSDDCALNKILCYIDRRNKLSAGFANDRRINDHRGEKARHLPFYYDLWTT